MTIAIALQVHDGVVLASDSAVSMTDPAKKPPDNVVNVYNNGNKIFNLYKGLPIGMVVYGFGNIGTSSISTLVKDLRELFANGSGVQKKYKIDHKKYTIEDICEKVRQFIFKDTFEPIAVPGVGAEFGCIVAGYSSGAKLSEVWGFTIRDVQCNASNCMIAQGVANATAGGDPEIFSRLFNGTGLKIGDALIKVGIPANEVAAKVAEIHNALSVGLIEPAMPIRDAIDLAEFIVDTTAAFTRFKRGAGTVGGPTESAAITKHEGFKWVRRKHYFDETLNPRAIR